MSGGTVDSNTGEFMIVRDRLVTVEAKVDLVLHRLETSITDHEARLRDLERPSAADTDHETRLRNLEQSTQTWRGSLLVLTAILSVMISAGSAILVQLVGK
jgi:hypothetical protein